MNVQRNLIRKLMLHEIELGRNTAEENKNVCWAKGEDVVAPSTVMKKFSLG